MDHIDDLASAYVAAVYSKDPQAFLALYDEDVVVFDAWDQWISRGRAAWSAMVENWFDSLGEERVRVSITPVFSHVEGDLGTVCAIVRYAGLSAAGEELRALENRHTWTLKRRKTGWVILHEHSSSPADFKTMKVKLQQG